MRVDAPRLGSARAKARLNTQEVGLTTMRDNGITGEAGGVHAQATRAAMLASEGLSHVPHGFSTRVGGVSRGVFGSLNFGNPGELPPGVERDSKANIDENFRRVLEVVGAPGRRVLQVHQVHGDGVVLIRRSDASPDGVKADAIVTDDPRAMACVRVADCAPVLLASGDGRIVAAAHAGWRGVVAGVVPRAIDVMRKVGAEEIHAAIGPCISMQAFEVGPEVIEAFAQRFSTECVRRATAPEAAALGKGYVDVPRAIVEQLRGAGVSRVDVLARCSVREPEAFFSHRRDRGITGRMIGIVGPRVEVGVD